MTLLFEDKERDFKGSKLYAELEYEYLDKSARIDAKNVRDLLNSLFVQFPEEEKLVVGILGIINLQLLNSCFTAYLKNLTAKLKYIQH